MASKAEVEAYLIATLRKIQHLLYTQDSAQIIKEAKNKDVVIFLGNTRCGKSTIVNYCIGNKLTANQIRGKTYNITKENSTSFGPTIGSASTSETTIPTAWLSSRINGLIIDAPGFDDNRGEVQDIANSFYIKEVINNARSIKLIFISDINDIRNDNIGQFIKFLDVIHRMMPNVGLLNKGMVMVFTKDDEELTHTEMRQLLREKIIDEHEIKIKNRNLVEYFYNNVRQIINIRMPERTGSIDEGKVFQNLLEIINQTSSFSNRELSPISPSISEKSHVFLLEAHRHLTEFQEFDDVLKVVFNAFVGKLSKFISGSMESMPQNKADLIQLKEQIYSIRNSTEDKFEKLARLRQIVPEVRQLQETSDLFIKLKFVSFVDDVLKIKESNIFAIKINRLISSMASKVSQTIIQVQNILNEITNEELNQRMQSISDENSRDLQEIQNQINELQEQNKQILKNARRNNIFDTIVQGLVIAAKFFL